MVPGREWKALGVGPMFQGRSPSCRPPDHPCSWQTVLAAQPALAWLWNLPDTEDKVEGQGTVLGPPVWMGTHL